MRLKICIRITSSMLSNTYNSTNNIANNWYRNIILKKMINTKCTMYILVIILHWRHMCVYSNDPVCYKRTTLNSCLNWSIIFHLNKTSLNIFERGVLFTVPYWRRRKRNNCVLTTAICLSYKTKYMAMKYSHVLTNCLGLVKLLVSLR